MNASGRPRYDGISPARGDTRGPGGPRCRTIVSRRLDEVEPAGFDRVHVGDDPGPGSRPVG